MKEIKLHSKLYFNLVALVDDEDFEKLNSFRWYPLVSKKKNKHVIYARTVLYLGNYKRKTILMHKEILKTSDGNVVDHIDGNGLNNQKNNIREASIQQNACNQRKRINSTSKYRGVHWDSEAKKWKVHIRRNGKSICSGRFPCEHEAAEFYNKKIVDIDGEFSVLNEVRP